MMDSPILLLGSGASVPFLNSRYFNNDFSHGLDMKLETIIKGNYSFGLNSWFKYGCSTTANVSVDHQFYEENYNELKYLPLIIACDKQQLRNQNKDITHPNTILLKKSNKYYGIESIEKGIYTVQLVGIYALSLAISLGFKEIYLLGYDCCEVNGRTHFYQGVVDLNESKPIYIHGKLVEKRSPWRGVGKKENGSYNTSTYNRKKDLNERWFAPFKDLKDIKIYNVSPESAIDVFEKIDYETFYSKVKNNHIDQQDARASIKLTIQDRLK